MLKKFFPSPARATFALSFLITSAAAFYAHYTIAARNGISIWKLFTWSLTSTYFAGDVFLTPIFIATLTALLVMAWGKTKVALAEHKLIRYSSRAGFVLLYPVLALFGVAGLQVAF